MFCQGLVIGLKENKNLVWVHSIYHQGKWKEMLDPCADSPIDAQGISVVCNAPLAEEGEEMIFSVDSLAPKVRDFGICFQGGRMIYIAKNARIERVLDHENLEPSTVDRGVGPATFTHARSGSVGGNDEQSAHGHLPHDGNGNPPQSAVPPNPEGGLHSNQPGAIPSFAGSGESQTDGAAQQRHQQASQPVANAGEEEGRVGVAAQRRHRAN